MGQAERRLAVCSTDNGGGDVRGSAAVGKDRHDVSDLPVDHGRDPHHRSRCKSETVTVWPEHAARLYLPYCRKNRIPSGARSLATTSPPRNQHLRCECQEIKLGRRQSSLYCRHFVLSSAHHRVPIPKCYSSRHYISRRLWFSS